MTEHLIPHLTERERHILIKAIDVLLTHAELANHGPMWDAVHALEEVLQIGPEYQEDGE